MKRTIAIILAALLLPLASCAKGNAAQPTAAPSENAGVTAAPGETPAPASDPYEDYNNRFMIRGAAGGRINWAETRDYLFFNRKYFDKQTGECEFYCSKPECTHSDETCEANFGVLGIFKGKLYGTRAIPGGERRVGLYTQNIDGSERKLIREIAYEEMGDMYFHRGKIYSFIKHGSVVNGAPLQLFRLILIDPYEKESRILFENEEYPGGAGGWLFFRDNLAYLLIDYRAPQNAEEYPGCRIWELWTYDIEKDEMKLASTDHTLDGILHGCWITAEGDIYAIVEKDYEAENDEDWRWYYSLAKLTNGKFEKLWDVEWIDGMGYDSQISDGTVVTQYCDNWINNPNVRFRVQDFDGAVLADDYLPFPDLGEGAMDFDFERYEVVWSDGECLWLRFFLEKRIVYEDHTASQRMILAVKYVIIDRGYSLAFTEPSGSFDF